ncbi:TMV resistance protein N-like protein [Tanacetum coccineum]
MASSTSSVEKCFKYDVFLSFRGEDTRENFVDNLYDALEQQGIDTYKDDEEIVKGKRIYDELMKSIEDSKFYIIVFSKNYASSSWCLDELVKIMECEKTTEHTAYPIFYDVEPTQIRKQSGVVGAAFAKHIKGEAAGKWKEALIEAANLAGWELKNTPNGQDEAKLISKIVDTVSLELRSIDSIVDEKLVGMEHRIGELESSIGTDLDDVRMIGIKGIGGGGKTTLARAIFDKLKKYFDGASFVDKVSVVSKTSGLQLLQKQILSDVLYNQGILVGSVHDGKATMKKRLPSRKVLVVLDDIDHLNQLEALAGACNWFKSGSRIIITTRDEQVLVAHGVKWIHNVSLLTGEEAMRLFSRYAFGREIPVQGYKELSLEVVRYAAGLPLTIKVLGSFLCGKNTSLWKDALERLQTIPEKETLKILELSYIALEDDYKEIFLDVVCLLQKWGKDEAVIMLESCGFHARNGLRVLEQKSLITIRDDAMLEIHDLITEMGRNIVRRLHPDQPWRHSRLWIHEEVEEILANDLGTEDIKCIEVFGTQVNLEIVMKGLRNMKRLRYLWMDSILDNSSSFGDVKMDEVSQYLPNALRYLFWDYYPFQSLPKTFQANNLVTLVMRESKITELWEGGERKALDKLRFLNMSESKLKTLNLALTPNLEMLLLQGCEDLVELHAPIGCLQKLIFLDLGGCSRFLSVLFMRRWESLEVPSLLELHLIGESQSRFKVLTSSVLHLFGESPEEVPQEFEGHKNKIEVTCYYKELTSSVGKLYKFLSLQIQSCAKLFSQNTCTLQNLRKIKLERSITEVPEDIGHLNSLEELSLSSTRVRYLPDSICMSKNLRSLELVSCHQLESLPQDLGHIGCLEKLSLFHTNINHLPDSICMLKNLKSLKLKKCRHLEKLPEDLGHIKCLEKLHLMCRHLKHLPDSICMLKHLKSLKFRGSWLIEKLPNDLGQLECLEKLTLSKVWIIHLPDSICMLKRLKYFKLEQCQFLWDLPEDIGELECLEILILIQCDILDNIPESICKMKRLRYFCLNSCYKVKKLPEELGCFGCLEELNVTSTAISHLPQSISLLKGLRIVGSRSLLESCAFATEIQSSDDGTFFRI